MNNLKYIQGQSRELRRLSTTQPSLCAPLSPASLYFALSLSIQRDMYNYKGYKKGSNINRQIYRAHLYMPLKCKEVILYPRTHAHTHTRTHTSKKEKQ